MSSPTFIAQFLGPDMRTRSWALVGPKITVEVWVRSPVVVTNGFDCAPVGGVEIHRHSPGGQSGCLFFPDGCEIDGSFLLFETEILPNLKPGLDSNNEFMRAYLLPIYEEENGIQA